MILGFGYFFLEDVVRVGEEKLKRYKVIMDLMMEEEFENLEIINYLRIKCIVRGFGVIMVEVREFFN